MNLCCADEGSDQGDADSPSESTADKESTLNPVPLSRSTIMPTPNIVYLNDWFGGGRSLISDVSDERYGILPRSETGRRLYHKRHKRQQRRAEDTTTTLSENVSEYKGSWPVDQLLAFINSDKMSRENPNSKSANSTASKKERSIRRKKKQTSDRSEDSDRASVSTMDTSSCCGFEAAESLDSIADAEMEIRQSAAVADDHPGTYEGVQNVDFESTAVDFESTASDHDRFVVVQKKKKVRQPVPQFPRRQEANRRIPYSSTTSTPAVRCRPAPQVPIGYEPSKLDDVVSLTSDAESTSSYPYDGASKTTDVRCSSPDFPDLAVQSSTVPGRRNSTGNVYENVGTSDKLPLPPSTMSYAIVAAGGIRPSHALDMEWRHSFDSSADAVTCSQTDQLGASGSSADQEYFCSSSVLVGDKTGSSAMPPENFHDMPSRTDDDDNSEPSTPTGYCSADSHSIVSDDLAKELHGVKLQNVAKQLQIDSTTSVPFSTSECVSSLVDRKVMPGCDRRSRLPASPVVFLDIASEHRPIRSNLGVSFGFDSSDSVCKVGQSECSSSESGFSDCTVHTDGEKISSTASTDSATSPIDPQDFIPMESTPTSVVQTVTVGHCRPIVPFITTTGHQSGSHTPVGIVPPIPQVDRVAEAMEQDMSKDSKQDILTSVIGCDVQKGGILDRELRPVDKQFPCEKSLSSDAVSSLVASRPPVYSSPAGGFNLLSAQLFLYAGR